jgi:hypothetical protein
VSQSKLCKQIPIRATRFAQSNIPYVIATTILDEDIMHASVIEFGTLRHFDAASCCKTTGNPAWTSIRHPTGFVLQPLFFVLQ